MLAGCSSIVSPRRASAAQIQGACHFQLPLPSSMSTQRLDLPCSFPSRSQSSSSIRPQPPVLSLPVGDQKPIDSSCYLKQTVKLPPSPATNQWEIKRENHHHHHQFWREEEEEVKGKKVVQGFSRKRRLLAEDCYIEDQNVKRKRGLDNEGLDFLGHLDTTGNLWFHNQHVSHPHFSLTCSGGEGETHNPGSSRSSSFSSEDHSYGVSENPTNPEHGNGSRPWNHSGSSQATINPITTVVRAHNGGDHEQQEEEEKRRGFELISLLTSCIESISTRNIRAISHYIARLGEIASPRGGSPITRLVAYFTEALAIRVTRIWSHVFHVTLPRDLERADDDTANALRLLNQVSPIPKFIHFTANEMLLRSFEGKDKVHVIDFDIKQGLQWPAFFQSLATRENPPSHVRITGIGESKQDLIETGEQLHGFAEAFNLEFEFHPVVDRLEDVRLWMLHVKEGESVAINCVLQLHKLLYDSTGGAFRDFMGLVRSTNPVAIVMAEQEAEHNEMNLERRACNSLRYYSAIFDMIHSTNLAFDSATRVKTEEAFAREIRNMFACEGRDRFERHESFGKWSRRMMDSVGFRCIGVSDREVLQTQMLLKMYDCEGYNVEKMKIQGSEEEEECQGVTLNWLDQPLYTVSAWKPNAEEAAQH
ncbi:hypothetical protein V2J09_020262 [Rumex salicifolius]